MGIYLNPGNENFKSMVSGDIYVDKTMMLEVTDRFIDKGNKYVCVSRPRRFGKTIAGNMLAAYYSKGCDSAKLFSQYKIAGTPVFGQKMNKYNVIKIDMNSEYQMIDKKEEEKTMRSLVLYKKETCPYCRKVMGFISSAGRKDVIYRDIVEEADAAEELVRVGGKRQVPCLFIDGKPLYESLEIIRWLEENPEE